MKTQINKYNALIGILLLLCLPHAALALGLAKIHVSVVDESGIPVEKASVSVRFSSNQMPRNSSTDNLGICEISASSNDGVIIGDVNTNGYYVSVFHHDFIRKNFGMWQPWNKKITVVLRPIVNPVPMYVRNKLFDIPVVDKEIGFDLMKADWVIPYGQGTQSNFIFKMERDYNNYDDYDATLTVTFSKPYDGIQLYKEDPGGDFDAGSWYRLPRTAPLDGYQKTLAIRKATSSRGYYARKAEDENYLFRVRSEVDKDGKLKRAMYGKIRGPILLEPRSGQVGEVKMHYYLNPDYTRNLEFDPKRNLFPSLPKMEGVAQP
jgi:hypothetical protein